MNRVKRLNARVRAWRLVHGYYMRPEEVELYRLGADGRDPTNYIGYRFFDRVIRPVLNDPEARSLTDNKWIFYQLLLALGLPVPRTYALYDPTYGVTTDGKPCTTVDQLAAVIERERPQGLVIKPALGSQGRGVVVFDQIDYSTGEATLRTGEAVGLWEEVRRIPLADPKTGFGYVVQQAVSQHADLSRINPYTANTLRVVTHMTIEGEVVVLFAVARFGRAGLMVDNWAQGGICVGVDIETGRLNRGVLKPKHGGRWVASHPDTGVEFVGMTIPMWQDAVEICRRAALATPGVRSIGWDLIVSPDGPVVLEANEQWDLIMVQVHSDGWLARPGMRDDLIAQGVDLPDHVPSTPALVVQMLKRRVRRLGGVLDQIR